ITAFALVPRASVCPCARCVEANTSPSTIAWQTPTATASCPIATWRKPGRSPARKRSSTFSSKRRMSSISLRKCRSASSLNACVLSTLAKAPAVYGFARERRAAVECHWIQSAGDVGARDLAAPAARSRRGRRRRGAARTGRPVPSRTHRAPVRRRPRRQRDEPRQHRPAAAPDPLRHADAFWIPGRAATDREPARVRLDGSLGHGDRLAPTRLERPLRGVRPAVDRLRRACRRAVRRDEPAARRQACGDALPLCPVEGLRGGAGDGAPLLRAVRRRGHPRHRDDPARAQRHAPCGDAGPGVDLVGPDALALAAHVRAGETSPRELAEAAIERCEQANARLNFLVTDCYEQALAATP